DEIGKLPLLQVAPFAVAAEPVVDHNVGAAGLVEGGDHIRSDEAGAAGDQQHPLLLPGNFSRNFCLPYSPLRRNLAAAQPSRQPSEGARSTDSILRDASLPRCSSG